MLFLPGDLVFVDESKARDYILVAIGVSARDVSKVGRSISSLRKRGQRRIHFKSESDRRRREILSVMLRLDVRIGVWASTGRPDKEARPLCLAALTRASATDRVTQLSLERDDSLVLADRRVVAQELTASSHLITYEHLHPHDSPLLWVSDAVAWCIARGGHWKRTVQPILAGPIQRV